MNCDVDKKATFFFLAGNSLSMVTVEHSPSDTGDMWYVRTEDGTKVAINPLALSHVVFSSEDEKGEK